MCIRTAHRSWPWKTYVQIHTEPAPTALVGKSSLMWVQESIRAQPLASSVYVLLGSPLARGCPLISPFFSVFGFLLLLSSFLPPWAESCSNPPSPPLAFTSSLLGLTFSIVAWFSSLPHTYWLLPVRQSLSHFSASLSYAYRLELPQETESNPALMSTKAIATIFSFFPPSLITSSQSCSIPAYLVH